MPMRLWLVTVSVLGLVWLQPTLRQAVIHRLGLHLALGAACGVGLVAAMAVRPGTRRYATGLLVLLLCWGTATIVQYFLSAQPNEANVGRSLMISLALSVIPTGVAMIVGLGQPGGRWAVLQVVSIVLAAAPLSTALGLLVAIVVFGEGP